MLKEKLEYTGLGYLFSLSNIFLTLNDKPAVGIMFGIIACYFFIKALSIKSK